MLKKLLTALAVVTVSALAMAPTIASADEPEDTRLIIRPGSSITYTADGAHTCSIGAVGRDDFGNLLAITAGHCDKRSPVSSPVYISTALSVGQVGVETNLMSPGREGLFTIPQKDTPDWSVILLDETKVRGSAKSITDITGANFTLTSIGGDLPGSGGVNGYGKQCVTGSTSAYTQGMVCSTGVLFSYDTTSVSSNNWVWSWATGLNGDSGGPLAIVDGPHTGEWIGIVTGARPGDIPGGFYQRPDKVVQYLDALGGVGKGFELVTDTW